MNAPPPRPPRPGIRIPADPRREPTERPPPDGWRELAVALGAANMAMPQIADRLERIELALLERPAQPYEPPPAREKFTSQHDVEEIVQAATKSERVREQVKRYSLEQGGRLLLWVLGIAGGILIAGAVGYALHDCQGRGASVSAPGPHP